MLKYFIFLCIKLDCFLRFQPQQNVNSPCLQHLLVNTWISITNLVDQLFDQLKLITSHHHITMLRIKYVYFLYKMVFFPFFFPLMTYAAACFFSLLFLIVKNTQVERERKIIIKLASAKKH